MGKFVYEFQPFWGLQGGRSGSAATICSNGREIGPLVPSEKAQLFSDSSDLSQIVTIEPFKREFNTDIYDNAAQAIEYAGLGYDFTRNVNYGAVTAEFAKSLSDYKVIIWNGHGSYTKVDGMHSILALGDRCTKDNFGRYQDYCFANAVEIEPGSITDSWEQIIASVNNGTYKTKYHIGDTKALDLGSEGILRCRLRPLTRMN